MINKTISFDELTNRELGEIELATGTAISDLFIGGKPGWLLTTAMAWLAMRRENPAITFDEIANGNYDVVADFYGDADPKDLNADK